jgi:hypothetical protein
LSLFFWIFEAYRLNSRQGYLTGMRGRINHDEIRTAIMGRLQGLWQAR